jgi:RNA polymerase sigma factor (sigma-70 family)
MGPLELDRPLQAEALREIERSLHGKLRAYQLSEAFIERYAEDALQKGLIEYFRAVKDGRQIDNRDAFVVKAAFCRAIDELRHETRRSDGALDAILDSGRMASPPTEDVAFDYLRAEELRRALGELSPEERQVLCLYYFEERTADDSAKILFCSERTYRRRLKQALKKLGQLLGAPVPEPGSELAIEIGLVAWAGLNGANAVLSAGPVEHLLAAVDSAREGIGRIGGHARDLTARMLASGDGERIGAIASGPLGKGASACAGTLALCALSGVIGPGVGGVDVVGGHGTTHRPQVTHDRPSPPTSSRPHSLPPQTPVTPRILSGARNGHASDRANGETSNTHKGEVREVKEQAYGFDRAVNGSRVPAASPEPPVPDSGSSASSETPSAPSNISPSEEQAQAEQQFGAFK